MFGADIQQFLTGEVLSSKILHSDYLYYAQGFLMCFG